MLKDKLVFSEIPQSAMRNWKPNFYRIPVESVACAKKKVHGVDWGYKNK